MIFNLRLALIGIVLAAVAFFVWDYTNTKAENKRLTNEIKTANTTIDQLGTKLDRENGITIQKDKLIKDIHNAPETDDGPVAPVLRRTIERVHDNSQ